jgi:hypothetical protein
MAFMSNDERSDWRDKRISRRHRLWGRGLELLDIDDIWIEYNGSVPVAMIEWKYQNHAKFDDTCWQWRSLKILAAQADLPIFFVEYNDDFTVMDVQGIDTRARSILWRNYSQNDKIRMNEKQFIEFEYLLRKRSKP